MATDTDHMRPASVLTRGVQITEFKETNVNPEPVFLEESDVLLEQYLSPRKLKMLTGVDNLEEVTSLELKVNTTETSLGNFGSLLPNLTQLKMSDSVIHSIRDIGSSLRGVRVLWMSQCGLNEVDGISSMTSLQEVYLPYNEISDISALSMLDDLQILDLEGNNIDDIAQMQYLALCDKLTRLTIEGNPVCTMRTPDSEEQNYNYREEVQKILPTVEILDDEPLVSGSQPSMSINAFDADWEYLEELQRDSLFQSPSEVPEETATSIESTPLRPATAYRPGSALRPSSGFRPSSASRRPATISGRPSTSIRPTTAFAERPVSSDAIDGMKDGGASVLTQGGVICGNPSRALRERRKITQSKDEVETDQQEYNDDIDKENDKSIVDELKEWRQDHSKRIEQIQASKKAQVLVIDHNDIVEEDEDAELNSPPKSVINLKITEKQMRQQKKKSSGYGDKQDESFECIDGENETIRNMPMTSNSPLISTNSSKLGDMPSPVPKTKSDRYSKSSLHHNNPQRNEPLPSTSHNVIPALSQPRPLIKGETRMRRQLPQVPSLPSKPPAPRV
ncbi:hypothetical protein LOTGIDRAFT_160627 [Lottia gigantea]|uniref:Leucine-rich repeat-containing protein 56 n=1 Tax=Lottia gigantea TaxID=225164 RepID=V4C1X8_LOTGI|nr:hypothetical protein LOTGIDRAFT_160627 [Lottia gigantea]ESO95474.1 hypothetical protein LOTGIDRAFT_160627 [Lottia gigantea]